MTEADFSNKNLGPGGAIIISAWISHKDNGALTKLIWGGGDDFYGNSYAPATLEVGMTEADLSNKNLGVGGATIVAAWISHKDNGALTTLDISNNGIASKQAGEVLGEMLSTNVVLKELNLSSNHPNSWGSDTNPGPDFAQGISRGLSDNGAISSVNLLKNRIPMEQAKALASILKEHPTLKSLCGNSGDETELDMSGKEIGVDGAIMLAPEIAGNRALTSLNLSSNDIRAEGAKIVKAAVEVTTCVIAVVFGTIFMSIWPLVELLLFTVIHRITRH
jgi:hypothetical protein